MDSAVLTRRNFIVSSSVAVGGLALSIHIEADVSPRATTSRNSGPPELSAWLLIGADDTVTVREPMVEEGNGIATQAAMTIAEELRCDWSKVRVEFASPLRDAQQGQVYSKGLGFEAFFSGRSTKPERTRMLLQAGASARERLKAAAAAVWKVPTGTVTAESSLLTHEPTGRTLRYGQVAAAAARIRLDQEPQLKPQSDWTVLGKASPGKLTLPQIVNGSLVYGIDVRLPNMAYAALRQSPVHGGRIRSVSADAVKAMPGVLAVVTVDAGQGPKPGDWSDMIGLSAPQAAVAVIAEHYWQASRALDVLPVEWDDGPGARWRDTGQMEQALLAALDQPAAKPLKQRGNIAVLDQTSNKIVEATYLTPYSEHACMEPLNGTACVSDSGVEVWHPSQHPALGLQAAAREAGVPIDKVSFHSTYIGGAFGRRIFGNDMRMVVAVAKQFRGRPVHVIWSREETTRQGRYRSMVAARLKAALDDRGMPLALFGRASSPDEGATGLDDTPYALGVIPNVRIEQNRVPLHLLTGPYRGPTYNSLAFMTETFIDECAYTAGIDPLAYRLTLLANWPDPGWVKCLREAATQAGWGKSLPRGWGQGIAVGNWGGDGKPQAGTTIAVVATVEVKAGGVIKVHQLDLAFDCGRIMNHDAVLTELQGGALFGYNMAFNERLTVKDGRVVEGNFDDYPIARTGDVPRINVHFGALTGHDRFAEIGEPPVGPIGPAIGNAVFKATGKRIRSTPFRNQQLDWA